MSENKELNTDTADEDKLVKPKAEFHSLLRQAGATKDAFTMKEVMHYLGQYIIQKQLYDQKQQHIVHCSQDDLGRVLGVDSFSVKEPRILFAMITKNLVAMKNEESQPSLTSSEPNSNAQTDTGTEEAESESRSSSPENSTRRSLRRRRRRRTRSGRSSDAGPSQSEHSLTQSSENRDKNTEEEEEDEESTEEEEAGDGVRKRRRSDSYSLTFDQSLSWCVIGGLGSGRDRHSSQSSDSQRSASVKSDVPAADSDSDSDNFSVEFEVDSVDSDDYNEDDASLSADEQVYEVTIFEAEDDDSFDEDTEISEADYWRCVKCDELNPPLPRNCLRCWTLRCDWLAEDLKLTLNTLPPKPVDQSEAKEQLGSDVEENEGLDVPDGKRAKTPSSILLSQTLSNDITFCSSSSAPNSQELFSSQPSSSSSSFCLSDSQQNKPWTQDSQPSSTIDSQELLPASPDVVPLQNAPTTFPGPVVTLPGSMVPVVPELERSVSAEWRLPESCLEPCVICQSRPKNGCIVHGRTGHLMSCYVCARKLKKRNKLCPVCRLPIQSVVLTYIS